MSINTLDEAFKDDMIKRCLLNYTYIYSTCFISPIFPGITDVKAIIERAKEQCNLIWLENLNLRGSYKAIIMDYIKENILLSCPCIKIFITETTADIGKCLTQS